MVVASCLGAGRLHERINAPEQDTLVLFQYGGAGEGVNQRCFREHGIDVALACPLYGVSCEKGHVGLASPPYRYRIESKQNVETS